jgi:hypothetical protein
MTGNTITNSRVLAERIVHRDGELFAARDLNDEERRDDLLRWLHVRYFHRTWGIARGFEVQAASGDSAVVVGPGYAVDSEGREILSSRAVVVPIPRAGGPANYVLTVSYSERAASQCCSPASSLVAQNEDEHPLYMWRAPQNVVFGPQVPLVNVKASAGQIQGSLDFRVRRWADRLVRPHIAFGSTEPGRTGWNSQQLVGGPPGALNLTVDTSAAGFTQTPSYFAILAGDFSGIPTFAAAGPAIPWPAGSPSASFLTSCGFISEAAPAWFTYKVLQGPGLPLGIPASITASEAESRLWSLHWLALQTADGCPPAFKLLDPSLLKLLNLFVGAM